jgi:hypothetical protein
VEVERMMEEYDCNCRTDFCDNAIIGNALDLDLNKCDSEVRADIRVGKTKKNCIRVWGQVKDCEGRPVPEAQVKLLKSYYYHGNIEFEGVAHTTTDCLGFYQFDVCLEDEHTKFRIIVGKASTGGKERVINGKGICNPCEDKTC